MKIMDLFAMINLRGERVSQQIKSSRMKSDQPWEWDVIPLQIFPILKALFEYYYHVIPTDRNNL